MELAGEDEPAGLATVRPPVRTLALGLAGAWLALLAATVLWRGWRRRRREHHTAD